MTTANIYSDAELHPTKDEFAAQFSTLQQVDGSYRACDRDDKVGIEVLVGQSLVDSLIVQRREEVQADS